MLTLQASAASRPSPFYISSRHNFFHPAVTAKSPAVLVLVIIIAKLLSNQPPEPLTSDIIPARPFFRQTTAASGNPSEQTGGRNLLFLSALTSAQPYGAIGFVRSEIPFRCQSPKHLSCQIPTFHLVVLSHSLSPGHRTSAYTTPEDHRTFLPLWRGPWLHPPAYRNRLSNSTCS